MHSSPWRSLRTATSTTNNNQSFGPPSKINNNATSSSSPSSFPSSSYYNATLLRQYARQRQQRRHSHRCCRRDGLLCVCCGCVPGRHSNNKKDERWQPHPQQPQPPQRKTMRSSSCLMKFGLALFFITAVMALWGYQRQGWRTTHQQKYNASSVYSTKNRDNHLSPAVVLERQQKQTFAMTTLSSSTTNTEILDQNAAAATQGTVPFENVNSDKEEEEDKNAGPADNSDETKEETSKLIHRAVPKIQEPTIVPDWLASYIEFHLQHVVPVLPPHSLRSSHQNQTEQHRSSQKYQLLNSDTTKYLRWTCRSGCGGLGDRLNGILQTFLVAFCTDRVFLLDDYYGSSNNLLLQPNRIPWRVDRLPPAATQLSALDDRNHTLLQDPANLRSVESPVAVDWQTNLWMESKNVDSPCWRERLSTTSARDFYRTAFGALFALSPELARATTQLQERAGLTLREHGGGQRAAPRYYYIAMHVRTGIVAGEHSAAHKRHSDPVEWRKFAECGHRLQEALHQHCGGAGAALRPDLYLAADHVDVKMALLRDDPSIKTVVDLNVVHLDKRSAARDRTDGGVDEAVTVAWSEWNVLREAACLVLSHSKYSQTAADTMTTPRCALYFDECDAAHVDRAIANLPVCVDDDDDNAAAR